jgi:hypothetical protein
MRPISHGVPQGSVLRPVLFFIYINDLETSIEAGRPMTFADDTSIFITGNIADDVKNKINITTDALTNWCEMNRLIINKEKTVAISFHQPRKSTNKDARHSYQLYRIYRILGTLAR